MNKKWLFIAPAAILGILLVSFLGGEVVQHLWNWLLPSLFGWPRLTFWQALGLLALCRILFGGSGWQGSTRSRVRRRIEERCARMPPEERQRFRQAMRARWGLGPSADETGEP